MKNPRPICPNQGCEHHVAPPAGFYRKRGYYRTRHNRQPVPRYQCRACGKTFSATRNKSIRKQHRPSLNRQLLHLLVSGVSNRRAALLLECSRLTVDRKVRHLAAESRRHHQVLLSGLTTRYAMMDELITFVHARPKQLSVAVVVRVKTGQVLGFAVSRIPSSMPIG